MTAHSQEVQVGFMRKNHGPMTTIGTVYVIFYQETTREEIPQKPINHLTQMAVRNCHVFRFVGPE